MWRRAWASEPGGGMTPAAVPAGDEAVHGLQIERNVRASKSADEEGIGGGVAPRPLDPRVEVAVHRGNNLRSDRDHADLGAFAEHPQVGGALGGLNRELTRPRRPRCRSVRCARPAL